MTQILLVGCGNMGGALLAGWCRMGDASLQITVINRSKPELPSGMAYHSSIDALAADYAPDAIILAVKPQQLDDVLPGLRARFGKTSPLYISVAAGKTLAYFAQQLGSDNVVRAMPNTPSMIGKGITVMCAPTTLPQAARQLSHSLLAAVGDVSWLADETLMDAASAVSGCGPAYLFWFIDCLAKAGVQAGLDEGTALQLAKKTIEGAALLVNKSSDSPEQLRRNVTSPGGITQAALAVLMRENGLEALLKEAVQAASTRSKEMKS